MRCFAGYKNYSVILSYLKGVLFFLAPQYYPDMVDMSAACGVFAEFVKMMVNK